MTGVQTCALPIFAFGLTPTGRVLAQRIADFFRFAGSPQRIETVSRTPHPSPDPAYPYNQFALSEAEAEAAAGFEVRTLQSHLTLGEGWHLHGFSYQASHNQVQQLYTYRSQAEVGIYLYLSAQTAFYAEDWGACPNATLHAVQINGLDAELLEGAVWTTYEQPTPGAQREWRCEAVGGLAMSLRWAADGLYYQISLTQFETRSDLLFAPEDLIELAEELR